MIPLIILECLQLWKVLIKTDFLAERYFVSGVESDEPADSCLASFEWTCPKACKCADGIADCRQKKLTTIPKHFPEDTTEM